MTSARTVKAAVAQAGAVPFDTKACVSKEIALYCAPTADDRDTWLPTMQHIALEGRCFVLTACQFIRRKDFPASVRRSLGDSPEAVLMRGGSAKFDFDVTGHYSRPDVFQLTVNESPMRAVKARDPEA